MEFWWGLQALDLMYFEGQSLCWRNSFVALDLLTKTIQPGVLKAWLGEHNRVID